MIGKQASAWLQLVAERPAAFDTCNTLVSVSMDMHNFIACMGMPDRWLQSMVLVWRPGYKREQICGGFAFASLQGKGGAKRNRGMHEKWAVKEEAAMRELLECFPEVHQLRLKDPYAGMFSCFCQMSSVQS